jgi:hypothetical protein
MSSLSSSAATMKSTSVSLLWLSTPPVTSPSGVALRSFLWNATTQTNNNNNSVKVSAAGILLDSTTFHLVWHGGYRVDGVVLPSSAVCSATTTTTSTTNEGGQGSRIIAAADVVIAGRLPFSALLGSNAAAMTMTAASSTTPIMVVGGLVCVGPQSQSALIANIVSSASRDVRDAAIPDYCIGRVISDDAFILI